MHEVHADLSEDKTSLDSSLNGFERLVNTSKRQAEASTKAEPVSPNNINYIFCGCTKRKKKNSLHAVMCKTCWCLLASKKHCFERFHQNLTEVREIIGKIFAVTFLSKVVRLLNLYYISNVIHFWKAILGILFEIF